MVIDKKKLYMISLLFTGCLLFTLIIGFTAMENRRLMGITILSPNEYERLSSTEKADFNAEILFNGAPAAIDKASKTIYISRQIDDNTKITDLSGSFSVDNPANQLFFIAEDTETAIGDSLSQGNTYKIAVRETGKGYTEYSIVFTTLPVLNIDGVFTDQYDEGRPVFYGKVALFDSNSSETGQYRTVNMNATWHVRGNITTTMPKKSWKISLKNNKGEKENVSLCGLGEDDDWILNAMSLDDLCLRERFLMDLWNVDEVFTENNTPMSRGEYVEVVNNGEYLGLFLLQRRVDKKYLNLDNNSILIKGNSVEVDNINMSYFEIEHSPYTEAETVSFLEENFFGDITENLNIENLIETNLFVNMSCALDNSLEKNIFRRFSNIDGTYVIDYILWDTDMSFGISWLDGEGFVYDFNQMATKLMYRYDFEKAVKKYPELEKMTAERWFELRNSIFSDENITTHIEKLYDAITYSDSLQRDYDKWGLYYKGKDNMDNFYKYINTRMEFLDEYYLDFIKAEP